MKVYWRDREGNFPPPDALFSWRPFFPDAIVPKLKAPIRVTELPPPAPPISVLRRYYLPERSDWISAIGKALDAIEKKILEKIVLARICVLECQDAIDPFAIVSALKERAQSATLFCFAEGDQAFLGATPERLFTRRGTHLESEAVAGTRKRGKTPHEDADLERELLWNEKEIREFTPVHRFLDKALSPLCLTPLSFSPLSVRKTQNVQHLNVNISGQLRRSIFDADILDQIHPTPALCGMPKRAAFEWIRKLEPFERGLYGGAIGWSAKQSSEWVAAIRCCSIRGNTATLYAGTGIVAGSNPEAEWEELDLKLKLFDGIFV